MCVESGRWRWVGEKGGVRERGCIDVHGEGAGSESRAK